MSMHGSTKPRDMANNMWAQLGLLAVVAVVFIAIAWRYVW
jgi:hypothetical protein